MNLYNLSRTFSYNPLTCTIHIVQIQTKSQPHKIVMFFCEIRSVKCMCVCLCVSGWMSGLHPCECVCKLDISCVKCIVSWFLILCICMFTMIRFAVESWEERMSSFLRHSGNNVSLDFDCVFVYKAIAGRSQGSFLVFP